MGKAVLRTWTVAVLAAAMLVIGGLPGAADPSLEETKKLLQKSLTLYEIDQEIARLSEQEKNIGATLLQTEDEIKVKEKDVTKTREHAGKVLRAYYMGDRNNLWGLIFSAKSFSDMLTIYEYFSMIIQNDQRTLKAYSASYKDLETTKDNLVSSQNDLRQVKSQFIAQREKVVALQKEIDEQLKASKEAQALLEQMNQFTKEWKEIGIPLFRKYLSSLSEAMQSLPELLTGDNASKYVKSSNLFKRTMDFEIGDTDLNEFFRSKNPIFNNLTFRFEKEQFTVLGKESNVEISLKGHYTVENEPVNKLQFHVDELTYNGFVLPETSDRALEQEFDLGFVPGLFIKNLTITDVKTNDGKLSLSIKL